MKAVILAGGLGTRLKSQVNIPKPMTEVCGVPVLERQLLSLKAEGISEFLIITHHLSEVIEDYFGNGEKFGVSVEYFREETPMGTAGALFAIKPEEDFLFLNGDLVFSFSLEHMLKFHRDHNALVTCFAHHGTHPADSTLLDVDKSGRINRFILRGEDNPKECTLTNAGIFIVSHRLMDMFSFEGKADFDRDVLQKLEGKDIFAYESFEYVKDMGTKVRLAQVENDLKNGIVETFSKHRKQKAVFLDRDGTLNKYVGYVHSKDKIQLTDGVADVLKKFRSEGYLLIVVTNQPTVARGENTIEEIEEINNHLRFLLCKVGAAIDGIYFCPHHPDKGFEGENPEYKIDCSCRKPKPGMIFAARDDFNIDLSQSIIIGDSDRDVLCGKNAGVRSILIETDGIKSCLNLD